MSKTTYHIAPTPFSAVDAGNRIALATGSLRDAGAGMNADYNGKRYEVMKTLRGYYLGSYRWAGRHDFARGSAEEVVRAAVSAFDRDAARGVRGSSVRVDLRDGDTLPADLVARLSPGECPKAQDCDWWTDAHEAAHVANGGARKGR